eukprot:TRINITY_DN1072_c0_g1_i1.p1 TRINITY_DN1072_c0_g1~~TRINITY_DN1072_c0_g1_i1.p1  ORF type:complete len:528 (-),score=56.38 TRINITY_DN1072_c0_g1_i1:787-2250(-)
MINRIAPIVVFLIILGSAFAANVCDNDSQCGAGVCALNHTCVCNEGVTGETCFQCSPNHYNFPNCTFCSHDDTCSSHGSCVANGTCFCNSAYTGELCDHCSDGHYNYPDCTACTRDLTCWGHGLCTKTGGCECFPPYMGDRCDQCINNNRTGSYPDCKCLPQYTGYSCEECSPFHYNFPDCVQCIDEITCSGQGNCSSTGVCVCSGNSTGPACDQCSNGFFNWPICAECNSNTTCGGNGVCNARGTCDCTGNWTGIHCDNKTTTPTTSPRYLTAIVTSYVRGDTTTYTNKVQSVFDVLVTSMTSLEVHTYISSTNSSKREVNDQEKFQTVTMLYGDKQCADKQDIYIKKMTDVFNSTSILDLLQRNSMSYYSGSVVDARCTGEQATPTTPPTEIPATVAPTRAPTNRTDSSDTPFIIGSDSNELKKKNRKLTLALGLGLGLGVPLLLLAIFGMYYYNKHDKKPVRDNFQYPDRDESLLMYDGRVEHR